jgi:hypothetical protein
LSVADIVRFYRDDEKSQAWIGLKARLSSVQVRAILVENGVRLRTSPEVRRLAVRTRMGTRWPSRPVFKGDA